MHAHTGDLAPAGRELAERNRELLAERCGWPDGALDAVRDIEARYPDYFAWWTAQGYPDPVPGYGAARREQLTPQSVHGATPEKLAEAIEADIKSRASAYELYGR
jgi:hypothetical protein